jgi:hypothetical protein
VILSELRELVQPEWHRLCSSAKQIQHQSTSSLHLAAALELCANCSLLKLVHQRLNAVENCYAYEIIEPFYVLCYLVDPEQHASERGTARRERFEIGGSLVCLSDQLFCDTDYIRRRQR